MQLKILMLKTLVGVQPLVSPRQELREDLRLGLKLAALLPPVGAWLPAIAVLLLHHGPVLMTSTRPPTITGGRRAMDVDGIGEALITHTIEANRQCL